MTSQIGAQDCRYFITSDYRFISLSHHLLCRLSKPLKIDIIVIIMPNPCISCGACCAFFRVSFYWGESGTGPGLVPAEKVEKVSDFRVCMAGTDRKKPRCDCLDGTIGVAVRCSIYEVRPGPCRDFQASWSDGTFNQDCDNARAAYGLLPIVSNNEGDSGL